MSTPGIELPHFRSVGKRSPHCAMYAPVVFRGTFSYLIRYSRLKCPETPVFPSSVADSHFDLFVFCLQHFVYLQYTSFICNARFYLQRTFFYLQRTFLFAAFLFCLQRTFFICGVLFLFAAFLFCLQRFFFICSVLFLFAAFLFCLQRFFFVCSVSFLFAAFLFCLQHVPCGPSYISRL